MLAACLTSALFLTSYLTYHYQVGSKPFLGQGSMRVVYFTILISHTILAVVIVPLVIMTVYRAWRGQWLRHQRLARWTLPLWLYVSVTGVIIYLMLYQLYPTAS
jgi:putative membrane protein